jgi:hypothetical protein
MAPEQVQRLARQRSSAHEHTPYVASHCARSVAVQPPADVGCIVGFGVVGCAVGNALGNAVGNALGNAVGEGVGNCSVAEWTVNRSVSKRTKARYRAQLHAPPTRTFVVGNAVGNRVGDRVGASVGHAAWARSSRMAPRLLYVALMYGSFGGMLCESDIR